MKKLVFITTLLLLTGITFGQDLKKGNLLGTHVMMISLQTGVTMEQYTNYCVKTWIPTYEKLVPGVKLYLVKGIRGENKDSFGMIFVFQSEKIRNKYFNDDGSQNDLGKSISEKMRPTTEKLNKLGTFTTKYTDWIVQ
jgi:hypothetical protein